MFANDLADGERFSLVDEIPAPQFVRREADRGSHSIQMAFQGKHALRRAESAKSAVRRGVGGDGAAANAHVRAIVWTGGMDGPARKHDRRKSFISATIEREIDIHGQEFSVAIKRGAMTRSRWVALRSGDHVFGAIVDHLYGLAGFPREQRRVGGNHRRVFFLAAKPAAGFGLNHAHAIFRQAENRHQRFVNVVRTLQRTPNRNSFVRHSPARSCLAARCRVAPARRFRTRLRR